MPMTMTQFILIAISVIAIIFGIFFIINGIKRKNTPTDPALPNHDYPTKDGLPIIPVKERDLVNSNPEQSFSDTLSNQETAIEQTKDSLPIYQTQHEQEQETVTSSLHTTKATSVPTYQNTQVNIQQPQSQKSVDTFAALVNATETIAPVIQTYDEDELKTNNASTSSPILDNLIQAQIDKDQSSTLNNAERNLNISLIPSQENTYIKGTDLLILFEKYWLRYGAMRMFHRYEDKECNGSLLFSVMMINDEGQVLAFDLNRLPHQLISGLVLFVALPNPQASKGCEMMISLAELWAKELDATIYNEKNQPFSAEDKYEMKELAKNFKS